jgi:hypothetical protein
MDVRETATQVGAERGDRLAPVPPVSGRSTVAPREVSVFFGQVTEDRLVLRRVGRQ